LHSGIVPNMFPPPFLLKEHAKIMPLGFSLVNQLEEIPCLLLW